jgi:pimeloyl-ACP methyl ester carboxylesterase
VDAPLTEFVHDGFRFGVVDSGPRDGEVVILLHGFPQTSASWSAVTPHLTAAGYRVLAPDQRGYSAGARPSAVAAYRLDHLGADVLALADAAGATSFHVVGHDWGGAVAWYLAGRRSERVRTLSIASSPHPRAFRRSLLGTQALRSWYFLLFGLPRVPEFLLLRDNQKGLRQMLAVGKAPNPADSLRLVADASTATAILNWYRAVFRLHVPLVGMITVPTVYVWSNGDTALGRRTAALTGDYVRAPYTFATLCACSHWIPEERPQEFADLVLANLARS